ncbi:MAG: PaaI family thioesterase, partial [Sinobacteraceae bacterium]|nr:PaaI family thioesterase [Nevskiaceae bacterium]
FSAALGIETDTIDKDCCRLRMSCRGAFMATLGSSTVHNGIVTALIDSTCGCAVAARIGHPERIATLDLRVDYLRPAQSQTELFCEAVCHSVASNIAFVRATVWQVEEDKQPIATAVATFMRSASTAKAAL